MIVQAAGPAHVPVLAPGLDVAVYCEIAEPPLSEGAVKVTVACPFPPAAPAAVGAPGTVAGVTLFEAAGARPR